MESHVFSLVKEATAKLGLDLRCIQRSYPIQALDSEVFPVKGKTGMFLGVRSAQRIHPFKDPVLPNSLPCGEGYLTLYPFTFDNYQLLSRHLSWLAPVPAGVRNSFGTGDRLGIASAAHVDAVEPRGVFPVLAQQSPRELEKTGRTFKDVLLGAAWGILERGRRVLYGADADHIRDEGRLNEALEAGFSFFTLDVSKEVGFSYLDMETHVLARHYDALPPDEKMLYRRYLDRTYTMNHGLRFEFREETLWPLVLAYRGALAFVKRMDDLIETSYPSRDLEISLDEGEAVTTAATHFLVAEELHRLGVDFQSLAVRFPGSFEKGVDFRGDIDDFTRALHQHSVIQGEVDGYRLSLHSGSDKFAVYSSWGEITGGVSHVKTSGTSWLKALETVALYQSSLFRSMYELSLAELEENRKAYQIAATADEVPANLDRFEDSELTSLLARDPVRQILHISYGSILREFKDELYGVLSDREGEHYRLVREHIERHLDCLFPE